MRKLLFFLPLISCFPQNEALKQDLFVVKDGKSFRIVGFVPAKYIREGAYIPALLFPKVMILEVGGRNVRVYADVLALTLDKQRKFKRAFLVSDTFGYSGEKEYRITVFKGKRKVGEIFGNLKFTEPKFEIKGKEIVKIGDFWHVYVFAKFVPAAKTYPILLALHNGKIDTFLPIEYSKFSTKYLPRDDFKYRNWYDEWIFVNRFKEIPKDTPFKWIFVGEIFGDSM